MKQLLAVFAVGLLIAAAPAKDDAKKSPLEGTWQAVSIDGPGGGPPPEAVKQIKLTLTADKLTETLPDGSKHEATYKVDASKKPATIDFVPTDGPNKGKTAKGIYVIEGDTLKIAFSDSEDAPRPKEFKKDDAAKIGVMTFKREK
jgi:uncharacterized protein (TIGR03067 family)